MTDVYPGVHPKAEIKYFFTLDERKIIECIKNEFYITSIGKKELEFGVSRYRYLLIKPTSTYGEMFNLDREIALIFSPYEPFQPRTLDAIPLTYKLHQALRIERICSIVVSGDPQIESKLSELLKNDQEAQVIVPFSYQELIKPITDQYFFRNRFKRHFFSRDLFASEAPLKKDIYFFGRNDLVHNIITRHRSHQVSGLFGLRKTGKTSVIFGIQRALEKINGYSAFIDCQNPSFHRRKWNKSLYHVLSEINQQQSLNLIIDDEDLFTEDQASVLFEKWIVEIHKKLNEKNLLIIFDEIENITPGVSPTKHWTDDLDFVFFWQTLRSLFQKLNKVFSYLIVGTNPLSVESERINGKDNPIYGQIPIQYIPRFDVPQTREMVRRLGKIMGMKFDEILYGKLTEDFGGHPYLIRHACSVILKLCEEDRPVRVDKALYYKGKEEFVRNYSHYMELILNVLKDYYNDEFEMLKYLAIGDEKTFKEFAELSPLYTNHLIGYGIIEHQNGNYSFRIEAIQEYLVNKQKYKKINLSQEEMWAEISERRNKLEPRLRMICRMQLQSHFGPAEAKNTVIDILGGKRKDSCMALSFTEIFDGNKSKMLFTDLIKIISKCWDCFKNIFGPNKESFLLILNNINETRKDAHANDMTIEEMQVFRLNITKIEKIINEFLG